MVNNAWGLQPAQNHSEEWTPLLRTIRTKFGITFLGNLYKRRTIELPRRQERQDESPQRHGGFERKVMLKLVVFSLACLKTSVPPSLRISVPPCLRGVRPCLSSLAFS